jgi:hypothetical protein
LMTCLCWGGGGGVGCGGGDDVDVSECDMCVRRHCRERWQRGAGQALAFVGRSGMVNSTQRGRHQDKLCARKTQAKLTTMGGTGECVLGRPKCPQSACSPSSERNAVGGRTRAMRRNRHVRGRGSHGRVLSWCCVLLVALLIIQEFDFNLGKTTFYSQKTLHKQLNHSCARFDSYLHDVPRLAQIKLRQ